MSVKTMITIFTQGIRKWQFLIFLLKNAFQLLSFYANINFLMEIKNNFLSIVVLGSFNPSILTSSFLANECKVTFSEKPDEKHLPIFSIVTYNNLVFQTTYENFQVIQNNIDNFDNPLILEPVKKYFQVLRYTPLTTCGINFNIDISKINMPHFEKLVLDDEIKLLDAINKKEILLDQNIFLNKESGRKSFRQLNMLYHLDDFVSESLSIQKKEENSLTINFNHEVGNLHENSENLFNLIENYSIIKANFITLIKNIFQE